MIQRRRVEWNCLALRGLPHGSGKETSMNRKKTTTHSFADTLWTFLRDNPELATMIAFELGTLAGNAVRISAENKKYLKSHIKKMPAAVRDAMPKKLSSALKFLPAPTLQPGKGKKHSLQRKAKRAA